MANRVDREAATKEYEERLIRHDWYYEHTEDQSVWNRGRGERLALEALQKVVDPNYELWDLHAPREFKLGRPKGKRT